MRGDAGDVDDSFGVGEGDGTVVAVFMVGGGRRRRMEEVRDGELGEADGVREVDVKEGVVVAVAQVLGTRGAWWVPEV